MKLKKIASLALAGVMAVSMLAGCSGSGAGENGGASSGSDVVTTSSIAKAFNDGQSATNDAKVTFGTDSFLDGALAKAAASASANANENAVKSYVVSATGYSDTNDFYDEDSQTDKTVKDGATVTKLYVVKYNSTDNEVWSEEAAMKKAAAAADDEIAELAATTYKKGVTTEKYFDYNYTGDVSMVTVNEYNGVVNYYIAYTITQTAAEKPVKAQ